MKKGLLLTLILAFAVTLLLTVCVFAAPSAVTSLDSGEFAVDNGTARSANAGSAIDIENGPDASETFESDTKHIVLDLWKETEDTEGFNFDQSFCIDINDAISTYNSLVDDENKKASYDINNNAYFYAEAYVRFYDTEYNSYGFTTSYYYFLHQNGLNGNVNRSWDVWDKSNSSSDVIGSSVNGGILNFTVEGTVKEYYDMVKESYPAIEDVDLHYLSVGVYLECNTQSKDYMGYISSLRTPVESSTLVCLDPHIRYAVSKDEEQEHPLFGITEKYPMEIVDYPDSSDVEGYYEPVKREYIWSYIFSRIGYDEKDDKWYDFYIDETKEFETITEISSSGTVYGISYGNYTTQNSALKITDLYNSENKAFIRSLIGEKSMGEGGSASVSLTCTVKFTYEDGKTFESMTYVTTEMAHLVAPCMHACTHCGLCTVTDEYLPCNFSPMMYESVYICRCDEPGIPEISVEQVSEETAVIESTDMTVRVVIDKVGLENENNEFIAFTTRNAGNGNTCALFNVSVFSEDGTPYTLNQWGDMGESLEISLVVGEELAAKLEEGSLSLFHVSSNGTLEKVEELSVDGDTVSFVWDDFSPFIVAKEQTDIQIDLGERDDENNIRYAEINGVVTELSEDGGVYTVEIGEENLLIEIVEKTSDGEFVKAQYFYVDMTAKTYTKLDMDSYMYTYDETSIRIKNPMGIRFKSYVLTDAKLEEDDFVIDEYGYIIATKEYLDGAELTLETQKKALGVGYNREEGTDIVFDSSDATKHVFTGVLRNIPVEKYKTDLVCKTYTKITVGGEQFVIYGEAVVGNVYDTAKAILAENPGDQDLIQIVLDYEKTAGLPGDELFEEE